MGGNIQGIKSEMKKVGNPYKGNSFGRESYYTDINFKINDKKIDITAKVDTGAAYTVFGLKNRRINTFAGAIMKSGMTGRAYDASGTELKLYGYIVDKFRLTDEIIIDKIKIYFSEDIDDKALLGMDILSLFDFQYLKERSQNWGTFWINNYIDALSKITSRSLNNDMDYVDPNFIADIDKEEKSSITVKRQ